MRTHRPASCLGCGNVEWMPFIYVIVALLGAPDYQLWKLAKQETRTIVTINGRDFRKLANDGQKHPGIVVIPSGGSPDAQLEFIMSAVRWVTSTNSSSGFSNRYLEVGD